MNRAKTAHWEELIAASAGTYRLQIREIDAPTKLAHHAGTVGETASTIKVLILAALLDAAQNGRLSLRKSLELNRDMVGRGGSGLLQSMYFNTPFTVYNLAVLMIAVSDNTATTALITLIGKEEINAYAKSIGLVHTRLRMSTLDFPSHYNFSKKLRLGESTAAETAELLEKLISGQLLVPRYTRMASRMLVATQNTLFGRQLPLGHIAHFGNKTGHIDAKSEPTALFADAGFIATKAGRTYIFAMFANLPHAGELKDSLDSPERLEFGRIGRALFDGMEAAPGVAP
jgi:beta-lactamase class A